MKECSLQQWVHIPWLSDSHMGEILSPMGHLEMLGDILLSQLWGGYYWSTRKRGGMLLKILQGTGQAPTKQLSNQNVQYC